MNKRMTFFMLVFFVAFGGAALAQGEVEPQAAAGSDIRLRFFEGIREGAAEPAKVITSSFLHSTITASIESEEDLAEEQKKIKETFNLKDVKLLTEAVLKWPADRSEKISHVLRIDEKQYLIIVSPFVRTQMRQFRVEVYEQSDGAKKNLLDTEVVLPARNIAVFGFEDMQQKPYFLALRMPIAGVVGGVEGGVEGGVKGGVFGGVSGGVAATKALELAEFEKGAVRCVDGIEPPKLLKKVNPIYPEIARQASVEGVVILEIKTDTYGRVADAKILRSVPLLDQAAIDAVRQWVYEPLIKEGVAKPAIFTVTVSFRLDGRKAAKSAEAIEEFAKGAVKVEGEIKPPQLIKRVDPVYPVKARKEAVEGVVILQSKIDTVGKVKDVMVLRSIPLLDQAAIDAVKQWVYEPLIIKDKPVEAVFTVTVRFELNGEKKKAGVKKGTEELEKEAVRATGEINPPHVIKKVDPVYPEKARKAGIEGMVILEAMTDAQGNVARVRVLQSIPELDQAAIDALKQWKYEPVLIDGKPKAVVFTVTMRFQLK
jgi:TonB family protein